MEQLNLKYIFQNALETFKVFETIPIEISGILMAGHATTIWQTLNHLIKWRAVQIQRLINMDVKIDFKESESWITASKPSSVDEWKARLSDFNAQTTQLNELITNLTPSDLKLNEKLKIIQDSSTHLAFHLGEIILIARQNNKYPSPSEMSDFLKK